MKVFLNRLSIKIADITICVDSQINLNRFRDIDFYKDFRTTEDRRPHCLLKLKIEPPPFYSTNTTEFNPANNWRLFDTGKKHILQLGFNSKKEMPEEVLAFNPAYTTGIIYKRNIFELFRRFFDQFIVLNLLSRRDGFLLHSSGLIWQGKGICFAGRSGAGKSTLMKIFKKYAKNKELLNDDRLAIRKINKKWHVFGTPWHGDFPVVSSSSGPLKTIFFIKQSETNYLRKLSEADTCQLLVKLSILPYWDKKAITESLNTITILAKQVSSYEMGFLPDKSVIDLIEGVI